MNVQVESPLDSGGRPEQDDDDESPEGRDMSNEAHSGGPPAREEGREEGREDQEGDGGDAAGAASLSDHNTFGYIIRLCL